ncbi:MAG: hypothetical protein ACE5GQ_07710, partial [Nitrospinales bacterium]
ETPQSRRKVPPESAARDKDNEERAFQAIIGEDKEVTQKLGDILGGKPPSGEAGKNLLGSIETENRTLTLGAIMPVAFNANDIRVLSFNLEIEMNNEKAAQVVREALPVYEKIITTTVEQFLHNKFYADILYVREKLKKRLRIAFNKSLKGGRVKKAKFKDFLVQ